MQDQSHSQLPQNIVADESSFFSYWSSIDIIKEFSAEDLQGALDQPVRNVIINVLSEGIPVEFNGETKRLRAMNASQILERVNEIAKTGYLKYKIEEIKRSNLYYHLNELERVGCIQEVGLIPKKNRLISYYGRTARVFLLNYHNEKVPNFLEEEALPTLMQQVNKEISEQEAKQVIEGLKVMYQPVDTDPINSWIRDNERQLRETEIDIRDLHNTFWKILMFDDETIAAMRAFAKAMKLEF